MITLILIFKSRLDAVKVHQAVDDLRNGKSVHDGLLRDRLARTASGTLSNPEENPEKVPSHTPSRMLTDAAFAEMLEALKRLVLAWATQPLQISEDDAERLKAMNYACKIIGKATGKDFDARGHVAAAIAQQALK